MQALSFAVHIPLVAFGISFPRWCCSSSGSGWRRGDELYLTLARRWSKVMLTLFAVGVITGTVLSFEMGLLWPNFTGTFGSVFGLGFAIEGLLVLPRGDLHRDLRLRLEKAVAESASAERHPDRDHRVHGVVDGDRGQRWMNHPGGFTMRNGKVVDVDPLSALFGNSYLWHELIHMYIAGYIVTRLHRRRLLRVWAAAGTVGPVRADCARRFR